MEKMNTRRPIKLLDNILDQAKWVDPGVRPGGHRREVTLIMTSQIFTCLHTNYIG